MFQRTPLLMLIALASLWATGDVVAEVHRGFDRVEIDGVSIQFGTVVEVEGQGTDDDAIELGYAAASLQALRINGKPTLENVEFRLYREREAPQSAWDELRVVEKEKYFRVRGRLMNARVTVAETVCSLVVEQIKPIPARPLGLADFVGKEVNFDGLAAPAGKFSLGNELATVEGVNAWPPEIDGKQIAIHGVIHRDDAGLWIVRPSWQLYLLQDLNDKQVSLQGILWSQNDSFWLEYRDEKLFLTSSDGPTIDFDSDDHGRPVRVSGKLVLQLRRPIKNPGDMSDDGKLVPCYVVRNAKIDYLERRLSWQERFGNVYPSFHTVKDGIPELLAETSFRPQGNFYPTTTAQLFVERNLDVIQAILRDASPKKLNILAQRMNNPDIAEPVRLIYAAILANANDDRGRSKLLEEAITNGPELDLNAIYCLGRFPFLSVPTGSTKIQTDWAEPTMLALMQNRKQITVTGDDDLKTRLMAVADATVQYSQIPTVLMMHGSEKSRQALYEYVLAEGPGAPEVLEILGSSEVPLSIEQLLRLECVSKGPDNDRSRRSILLQILNHEHPQGFDRFVNDMQDGFAYMDIRDHLSPPVLLQLQPLLEHATGKSKAHIEMLLILGKKDPVPELLSLLTDAKWKDKNLVFFELSRLSDPRVVPVVARVLRDSTKDYFGTDPDSFVEITFAVQNALLAISNAGTAEAIHELIGLLNIDLARFGGFINREGLQRIVAAHLIQMTGESFGTNADAWEKWRAAHPTYSVRPELMNPPSRFRTYANHQVDL